MLSENLRKSSNYSSDMLDYLDSPLFLKTAIAEGGVGNKKKKPYGNSKSGMGIYSSAISIPYSLFPRRIEASKLV